MRKLLNSVFNEDIRIKLLEEIGKDEEKLKRKLRGLEEQRRNNKDEYYHDAILTHRVPVIAYESGEKILTEMKWDTV